MQNKIFCDRMCYYHLLQEKRSSLLFLLYVDSVNKTQNVISLLSGLALYPAARAMFSYTW